MAEYGEWNLKGATLSHVTAKKEYGVDLDFIERGIRAGKLEYRHGSVWGSPYVRILRRQLEDYIKGELGRNYLIAKTGQTELRKIRKEISELKDRLSTLEARKEEIEAALGEAGISKSRR